MQSTDSNRPRVIAALIASSSIILFSFFVLWLNNQNQPNQPLPESMSVSALQKDVREAVRKSLRAYQVSGQTDPGIIKGLDNRMAPGMSAWYPTLTTVRISRPGGCEAWVRQGVLSYNRACLK